MMIYNDDLSYIGEWKDNLKEGMGKIQIKNKTISGLFVNDQMN